MNTHEGYYNSIDNLPLHNWLMCHEGKFEFVRRTSFGNEKLDAKYWVMIYDEHIKRFGLNENYAKYMDLCNKKALLQINYIETGIRMKLNKINALEARIQHMLQNNGESMSVGRLLQILSKFQGYPINKYTITVSEYFNLIENFKQSQQAE